MAANKKSLTLKVINGLGSISGRDWNACAGESNPFVSYEFLSALEDSSSVCAETGWLPNTLSQKAKTACFKLLPLLP